MTQSKSTQLKCYMILKVKAVKYFLNKKCPQEGFKRSVWSFIFTFQGEIIAQWMTDASKGA